MAQQTAPAPAPAVRVKGPLVWMDLDQNGLDDAYDQAKYAPNIAQVIKRYSTASEETRRQLSEPKRMKYGPSEVEALDIYSSKVANAPINIFVHGGAWRSGLARDYAFAAETFVRNGAHFVVLDFTNVVETKGDLAPMIEQVRRAITWVAKNAAQFGGDPERIYLSGHSSGSHLGGAALITDWQAEFGLSANVIKGALLVSGMYDLKAPRLSARSSYVNFTDSLEQALSTQRHLETISCPVALVYGSLETPEFQRQSRDFAAALKNAKKPVSIRMAEGYNHFEVIETLANPYGVAGRLALQQMGLSQPA